MDIVDRKTAFSAPDEVFGHPQRVVASTALSHDEKVALLRKWKSALETVRRPTATPAAGAAVVPAHTEPLAATGQLAAVKLAAVKHALMELRRQ